PQAIQIGYPILSASTINIGSSQLQVREKSTPSDIPKRSTSHLIKWDIALSNLTPYNVAAGKTWFMPSMKDIPLSGKHELSSNSPPKMRLPIPCSSQISVASASILRFLAGTQVRQLSWDSRLLGTGISPVS